MRPLVVRVNHDRRNIVAFLLYNLHAQLGTATSPLDLPLEATPPPPKRGRVATGPSGTSRHRLRQHASALRQ